MTASQPGIFNLRSTIRGRWSGRRDCLRPSQFAASPKFSELASALAAFEPTASSSRTLSATRLTVLASYCVSNAFQWLDDEMQRGCPWICPPHFGGLGPGLSVLACRQCCRSLVLHLHAGGGDAADDPCSLTRSALRCRRMRGDLFRRRVNKSMV